MDAVRFLNVEYIYTRIFDFFKNFDIVAILNAFIHFIEFLIPFGIILFVFLSFVIIYSRMQLKKLALSDQKPKAAAPAAVSAAPAPVSVSESTPDASAASVAEGDAELHERWQTVQKYIASDNPSDWKLAILEADIMLGDVLTKRGYTSETIGDQLKSVDPSDMLTLQDAWAAHIVRNKIAHGGSDFQVNEREARATIDLYKKVFSEFYHL